MAIRDSWRSSRATGNGGTNLGAVGVAGGIEGILHGITCTPDTTGGTITVWDNTAGSGTAIFQYVVPANTPFNLMDIDAVADIGLFYKLQTFTAPSVTVYYR